MPSLDHADDSPFAYRRFRRILQIGIAIMLLFCVLSFAQLASRLQRVEALSAAADTSFTLVLIGSAVLLRRLRLERAALLLAGSILVYSVANIVLFPDALIRIIGQPLLAVILALAYVDSRKLRGLSIAAWLAIALIFWLSNRTLLSNTPVIDFIALVAVCGLILLVLSQFHARMHETLAEAQSANTALHAAQAQLETQVAERTAALQHALDDLRERAGEQARLLAETEQQRADIRALAMPLLPISSTTLAAPLVGGFDAERIDALQQQALAAIERARATTLVLDVTGVLAVDQPVALGILRLSQAVRLMGTRVVLAGIRPEVAQTIVGLGLDLAGIETAATLQEGIAIAARG